MFLQVLPWILLYMAWGDLWHTDTIANWIRSVVQFRSYNMVLANTRLVGREVLLSWNFCLPSSRWALGVESPTGPGASGPASTHLQADKAEVGTTGTHHVLASFSVCNQCATRRTGSGARRLYTNDVLQRWFAKSAQARVFPTALFVATLVDAWRPPLVQAQPAELKPSAFLLRADTTDQPLVFLLESLTQWKASRTLLNSHSLSKIILWDFCFKQLLFLWI